MDSNEVVVELRPRSPQKDLRTFLDPAVLVSDDAVDSSESVAGSRARSSSAPASPKLLPRCKFSPPGVQRSPRTTPPKGSTPPTTSLTALARSPSGIFGREESEVNIPFVPLAVCCSESPPQATIVDSMFPKHDVSEEDIIIRLAQMYTLYGCPGYLVEENIRRASRGLGIACRVSILGYTFLIKFGGDHDKTTCIDTVPSGYHLQKLELIDAVCLNCVEGLYRENLAQAVADLDAIMTSPNPWADWLILTASTLYSMICTLIFFNGNWLDTAFASAFGFVIAVVTINVGRFAPGLNGLIDFLLCVMVSLLVMGLEKENGILWDFHYFPSLLGGIVWLLPGLSMTMSVVELSHGQVVSGSSRLVNSLFKMMVLALGIALGSQLAGIQIANEERVYEKPITVMKWYWRLLLAAPLASAQAVLLNSTYGQVLIQCVSSTSGFGVYLFLSETLTLKSEITTTLTAFVIATIGNMYGHATKRPSLIPTLSGILFLVPGGMGVRGALVSINGAIGRENGLSLSVFAVALSIAIGVYLSSAIVFPREKKASLEPLHF